MRYQSLVSDHRAIRLPFPYMGEDHYTRKFTVYPSNLFYQSTNKKIPDMREHRLKSKTHIVRLASRTYVWFLYYSGFWLESF